MAKSAASVQTKISEAAPDYFQAVAAGRQRG
jgi:hypothetical protein